MPEPDQRPTGDELTTSIYLLLLRLPAPRRSALAEAGYTDAEIGTALTTLESRGLISASRRDAIDVFPPDTTLPAWAAELERQARATRSAVEGLTHTYYQTRNTGRDARSAPDVVLLDTVPDIEAAFFRAAGKAEGRIVRLVARSDRMDAVVIRHAESILASRSAPASPALERLVVFEQSILEVDGAFAALSTLRASGVDVRLTPHLAFSVLAVDNTAAVVDISHLDGDGGSLYVTHRQLVSALMDMCMGLYSLSTPLPRTTAGPSLGRLTDRDAQILALLAAGASDSTIARQVGVSRRTVERRVRLVMQVLGATTRFQAGAIAATRGLL